MERDLGYSFVLSRARDISTHTLTWSVTDVEYGKATDFRISTHTLTWSVTGNNRTAPNVHVSISTHTLTWSVTNCHAEMVSSHRHFNSHAHVERDQSHLCGAENQNHFNSHAHVERDPLFPLDCSGNSHFNSHAHVERDHICTSQPRLDTHFNSHAHVERDIRPLRLSQKDRISTHTLTWSVTTLLIWQNLTIEFQLTRSRGA